MGTGFAKGSNGFPDGGSNLGPSTVLYIYISHHAGTPPDKNKNKTVVHN